MSTQKEVVQEDEFPLGEILNLSVTEILILQFLVRYKTPIIRIVLLESINTIVKSEKPIASSSFYLKLKRMEENGFVVKDGEERITVTSKGRNTINELQRLTTLATMQDYEITQEFLPTFIQKAEIPADLDRLLIVNLEEGIDLRLIEVISDFSLSPYLFADDNVFKSYRARGMSNEIQRCTLIENKIGIPNEFFDGVIIIGYGTDEIIYDATNFDWLQESMRTLKVGGIMVVSTFRKLEKVNNFIIDSVIENLRYCKELHEMDEQKLLGDMKKIGVNDPQIFDYQGLMLGYGSK